MKHLLLTYLLLLITLTTYAQVGIGTTTPDPSAQLDVVATDKGVLVPRVTSTSAVTGTVAEGLLIYQTGSPAGFYVRQAGAWVRMVTETDLPSTVLPFFSGTTITIQPNTSNVNFIGLSSSSTNAAQPSIFYPALPRNGTLTALTAGINIISSQSTVNPVTIQARVYRADPNSNIYVAVRDAVVTILIPPSSNSSGQVYDAKITGLSVPLAEGNHLLIGFSSSSSTNSQITGYANAAVSIK